MITRFALLSGLAFMAAIGISAPAAAQYSPEQVIPSVNLAQLKSIVESLGHTTQDEGEAVSLTVRSDTGLLYVMTGTACDVDGVAGCQGVMMQVQYGTPDTASYRTIAQANLEQAAINSWMDPATGVVGFTRYVVLDKGITMANLRENVVVLLAIAPVALETVKGAQE